ncbi:MAG TPA: tetratricopeptide repeat protein, partial [Candidatus Methylacidiphilales bacterium]|nr:tetratricopeptide repeat protein [Candidatus Methylacidiphilales bacterium]
MSIQEAERLETQGQKGTAYRRYQESYSQLDSMAKKNPDWEKVIVQYRLRYVRSKLSSLRGAKDATPSAGTSMAAAPQQQPQRTTTTARTAPAPAPQPQAEAATYEYTSVNTGGLSRNHITGSSSSSISKNRGSGAERYSTGSVATGSLRQQIAELQATVADLRTKLGGAVTESQDLRRKLAYTNKLLADAKAKRTDANMTALLAENASLKEKLTAAEGQIKELTSGDGDPNNASVAQLRAQLKTMQQQLTASEQANETFKKQNAELQTQLTEARQRLSESEQRIATTGAGSNPELVKENEALRSIVQRQMQEQARRDLAARLARDEMKRLKVDSDVLKQQVDILGSPLVALSDEELSMFRRPGTGAPGGSGNVLAHQLSPARPTAPGKTTSASAPAPSIDLGAPAPLHDKPVIASNSNKPTAPSPATDPGSKEYVLTTPADAAPPGGKPPGIADGNAADNGDLSKTARVPEGARALAQEATDLFNKKRFDDAAGKYQQIIDAYPDSLYAWSNLGVVRFQQQNFPEALRALQQAVKLSPNDDFSHSVLGIVYYQTGRFDEAV